MSTEDKVIEAVKRLMSDRRLTQGQLAEMCNVSQPQVSRWLGGKTLQSDAFCKILDGVGASVTFEESSPEQARDVCFVAPQRLSVTDMDQPIPQDYIAVPLADGPVAAGRGLIPEDVVKSWVLVWKNHDSVRFRTNLIAVEVGKGQNSMEPTLHPHDILLVDRDDFKDRFAPPGNIFLVREPDDSVLVKRVTLKPRNGDMMITFYSDNAVEYPPMSWSLAEDYHGDISRAVIGRVVWAWSDMSRK